MPCKFFLSTVYNYLGCMFLVIKRSSSNCDKELFCDENRLFVGFFILVNLLGCSHVDAGQAGFFFFFEGKLPGTN